MQIPRKKNLPRAFDALLPLFLGRSKGGCILCNTIIDSTLSWQGDDIGLGVPLGFYGDGSSRLADSIGSSTIIHGIDMSIVLGLY